MKLSVRYTCSKQDLVGSSLSNSKLLVVALAAVVPRRDAVLGRHRQPQLGVQVIAQRLAHAHQGRPPPARCRQSRVVEVSGVHEAASRARHGKRKPASLSGVIARDAVRRRKSQRGMGRVVDVRGRKPLT